jgi:5-methylcytosine-specific restriction endonuclease McrA
MRFKNVFFGKTKTLQIECPNCKTWQFLSNKCCECYSKLSDILDEEKRPEYRSEVDTKRCNVSLGRKRKVYKRDDYTCQYCGVYCFDSWVNNPKALTIDHCMPITGGGSSNIDNLVTCCRECNITKSNKRFSTFEEAREYIKKQRHYDYI